MTPDINIGFVGAGNMGQCAHLRNYASLPGCRVVALAEPRLELARRVAAKYGVENVYASAEEMVARERLDGLVAPQPFDRHGALVAPLYRFGLPILTEKPLASSVETGEAMLEALRAGGSWHMVGYHKRNDPATILAKEHIEAWRASGEFGVLRYVRIAMPSGDWIAGGFFDLLQSDEAAPHLAADARPADMDAATFSAYMDFVNFYIHQVNLLRFLLGEDYRITYAEPSGVLLAAQSVSGVAATIEMTAYRTTLGWDESALIAFEKGAIRLELPAPLVLNQAGRVEWMTDAENGAPPQTVIPTMPPVHAMRRQAENFCNAIRGLEKPACEAAEALQDLRVARDYIALRSAA